MTEYTPEDFAYARFAVGPDGRHDAIWDDEVKTWRYGSGVATDAKRLARGGWRPVVEADHPARPLAGYRAQVRELREKVRDLARAPITLDTLHEAWENAEVPTEGNPIRVGDAVISSGHGGYLIRSAAAVEDGWAPFDSYRILHRAPQPEPWQELMGALSEAVGGPVEPWQAQWAYERGLRVAGGDES